MYPNIQCARLVLIQFGSRTYSVLKQNEESSTLLKQKIVKNQLKLKHERAFSHLKLIKQTEYRLLSKCGKANSFQQIGSLLN